MKKILPLLCAFSLLFSCGTKDETKLKVLAPEGTPSLALANFYHDRASSYSTFDIRSGSDPLVAAFANESYDIIVAPTNLGAKFYQQNQKYVLYQTIVWGNLYLVSGEELHSLEDLSGKEITLFGKNSTPDIILRSLIRQHRLTEVTLKYVDDVSTANSLLLSGAASIIVTAQPSLSKIRQNRQLSVIDLQEEWKKVTGDASYPQASIFFRADLKGKIDEELSYLADSVNKTNEYPEKSAEYAISMHASFSTLGKDVLVSAIPECHYEIRDDQKEAIEFYFNAMKELDFSAQFGGTLPDENFYYHL